MKIVYFVPVFPRISETFVTREIEELVSQNKHQVVIVTWGREEHEIPKDLKGLVIKFEPSYSGAVGANIEFFAKNPFRYLKTFFTFLFADHVSFRGFVHDMACFLKSASIAKFVNQFEPDHLHTHFLSWTSSFTMGVSSLLDIPFSVTAHASDLFIKKTKSIVGFATMKKQKVEKASFVVTISKFNVEYLRNAFNLDESKIKLIRTGVNLSEFKGLRTNYPKSKPLFITQIGKLVPKRGFEYTVDACRKLKEDGVDFVCHFVGGPDVTKESIDYHLKLIDKVNSLGLNDKIEFHGSVEFKYVKEVLVKSHVVVSPSVTLKNNDVEGLPTSLIEAFLAKRPVIATNHTGIPELVKDGENGFLIGEKDVGGLVRCLKYINDNMNKAELMGLSGYSRVTKEYNIVNSVRKLSLFFEGAS